MEKRFFMLKTYCPKEDKQVDTDRCKTCRYNNGFDNQGLFVNCNWGEDNGVDI